MIILSDQLLIANMYLFIIKMMEIYLRVLFVKKNIALDENEYTIKI